VLLYVPIAILFVFSLNQGTTLSFPLKGFSLDWYGKILSTSGLLDSVKNSLIVATVSSTAATILGAMVAILLSRFQFRGKGLLTGLAILPLIVPYVVLGVAFLILFKAFNIELSIATVSIGHAIVALPYTTLIILVRLIGAEPQLEDAAMDLGATYPAHRGWSCCPWQPRRSSRPGSRRSRFPSTSSRSPTSSPARTGRFRCSSTASFGSRTPSPCSLRWPCCSCSER
jgi:hypothetical protein